MLRYNLTFFVIRFYSPPVKSVPTVSTQCKALFGEEEKRWRPVKYVGCWGDDNPYLKVINFKIYIT